VFFKSETQLDVIIFTPWVFLDVDAGGSGAGSWRLIEVIHG
jgi:hypothetical protein